MACRWVSPERPRSLLPGTSPALWGAAVARPAYSAGAKAVDYVTVCSAVPLPTIDLKGIVQCNPGLATDHPPETPQGHPRGLSLTSVFQAEYVGDLAPYSFERERLGAAGITFSAAACADSYELIERAKDAEYLWLEWSPDVTREVLEALPRCELVIRWGVGYDQIDVQAATELGVAVANAPTYCKNDVVEHTIGLVLAVCRWIPQWNAFLHEGGWRGSPSTERRLSGKTLGVVGVGHIGIDIARLGVAFGCQVLGNDVRPLRSPIEGVSMVDLDELLRESDVVCLNVSLQPSTRHLISDRALGLMKPDAVLVNTSRGAVVDEAALVRALEAGKFLGVGLDVFEEEPLPVDSPLRDIERVVLTPHKAATSPDSVAEVRKEVCDTTIEWATTGWAEAVVNPDVRPRHKSERTRSVSR